MLLSHGSFNFADAARVQYKGQWVDTEHVDAFAARVLNRGFEDGCRIGPVGEDRTRAGERTLVCPKLFRGATASRPGLPDQESAGEWLAQSIRAAIHPA